MAGVGELGGEHLPQVQRATVGQAHHEVLHLGGIGERVEWLTLGPALAVPAQELRVLLLDMGGIGEHHRAQIAGGGGTVDRPVKAVLHQQRQAAGMVDVRVAHHNHVDAAGIERQLSVELARLGAAPLEEARVEQDPGTGGLEQVHGAGDLARGAKK